MLLLAVSALAVCLAASGQEGRPQYYPEETMWVEAGTGMDIVYNYTYFEVKQDTVIEGKTYKCVYCNGDLAFFLREDESKKVYLRGDPYSLCFISTNEEFVAYDFDWEVGKVLETYTDFDTTNPVKHKITDIYQFKLLDGSTCNYIMTSQSQYNDYRLFQGIGDDQGLFIHASYIADDGTYPVLYSFTRGGVQLYQYGGEVPEAFHKYYPDGTKWVEERKVTGGVGDAVMEYDTYEVRGDTVLNGREYLKIYCNGKLWDWVIREEAPGRVYMRSLISKVNEFLVYTFDWEETGRIEGYIDDCLYGIDIVDVDPDAYLSEVSLSRLRLLDGSYCNYVKDFYREGNDLLQGIGDTRGLFYGFRDFDYYGETPRLYSFTRNGVLLYQRGMMSGLDDVADDTSDYKVVNDGVSCTVCGEGDFTGIAYDLSGRQLWRGRSDGGVLVVPTESLGVDVMLLRLQGASGVETVKLIN